MMHRNFWLALSFSLAACNNNGTLLHSYKPLPEEGWERRDTICFDVPRTDSDIDGTLYIGLRTKANLAMQDVVLAVELSKDTIGVYHKDTLRYPLTDAEGYALAGGVNLHQYETQHLPFRMQKGDSCSVRIHHLMRHEVISGITDVGIRIDRR